MTASQNTLEELCRVSIEVICTAPQELDNAFAHFVCIHVNMTPEMLKTK